MTAGDRRRGGAALLEQLQEDTAGWLGDIDSLIDELPRPVEEAAAQEWQARLRNRRRDVEELELRLAVVAPMKAGKSTLVNAIVGWDVLPNRAMPMTSLPTEIEIGGAAGTDPELWIPDEVADAVAVIADALRAKSQRAHRRLEQVRRSEDLGGSLDRILAPGWTTPVQATGQDEVRLALEELNDVLRLAVALRIDVSPVHVVEEIPRVTVPVGSSAPGPTRGTLVIVDTPGHDEATNALGLASLVQEQLEIAAVVMLVVNYTSLTNQAAAEARTQTEPLLRRLGRERLYLIVNKYDQRRRGDLGGDELKEHAAQQLELKGRSPLERVHLTAARRGLVARDYLIAAQSARTSAKPRDVPAVVDLLEENFPNTFEDELEDATWDQLDQLATKTMRNSGIPELVERAVDVLRERAAPQALRAGVKDGQAVLRELDSQLELWLAAVNANGDKVRAERERLTASIEEIESLDARARKLSARGAQVRRLANAELERTERDATGLATKVLNHHFKSRGGGSALTRFASDVGRAATKAPPRELQRKQYTSKGEAERFATRVTASFQAAFEDRLQTARIDVERRLDDYAQQLARGLKAEVEPLLEEARARLEEQFDVDLYLEPPDFEVSVRGKPKAAIRHKIRKEVTGHRIERREKRLWWTLWLAKQTWTEKIKVEEDVEYFIVEPEAMKAALQEMVDETLGPLRNDVARYLEERVDDAALRYVKQAAEPLRRYRQALDDSLGVQEASRDEVAAHLRAIEHVRTGVQALADSGRKHAGVLASIGAA